MKKKPGKYLKFYQDSMNDGRIPDNGLCACFKDDELFDLIDPERGENLSYWGFTQDETAMDGYWDWEKRWYAFTPLRQNVVLLMAAMNGEL